MKKFTLILLLVLAVTMSACAKEEETMDNNETTTNEYEEITSNEITNKSEVDQNHLKEETREIEQADDSDPINSRLDTRINWTSATYHNADGTETEIDWDYLDEIGILAGSKYVFVDEDGNLRDVDMSLEKAVNVEDYGSSKTFYADGTVDIAYIGEDNKPYVDNRPYIVKDGYVYYVGIQAIDALRSIIEGDKILPENDPSGSNGYYIKVN